ncbi:MAG: adenylate/guanylate cyclase domain-containing protein [Myxococcales bacterium]|nr:adenylate/guanylate cyclase domain-containing protein [Myxococcales bacterium]
MGMINENLEMVMMATAIIVTLLVILMAFRGQVRHLVNERLTFVEGRENRLLEVSTMISEELQLRPLLRKIMEAVTEILQADRATLFLYDDQSHELWSDIALGLDDAKEIRIPHDAGIAGSVFVSGETINIKDAYSDDRFNKAVDKKTGYRTRTILCQQVRTKAGKPIGVIQVLNKAQGVFDDADERNLRAFTAQAAVALENAQLFEEVMTVKNFNEAVLQSMANGMITVDAMGRLTKGNDAAVRLLNWRDLGEHIGAELETLFANENAWAAEMVRKVLAGGEADSALDSRIVVAGVGDEATSVSVNFSVQPLLSAKGEGIGALAVIEDITSEKRLKSTMARYMPKEVADRLLEDGEDALGGNIQETTILFSDIRAFTSFSEEAGPEETVSMLNDYFSIMVDQIMTHHGILDKYIGDAIMAVYGAPFSTGKDADNALKTAINMIMALGHFNMSRQAQGKMPIDVGIGLNTGEVVGGNIGSERRMDYTVIGDGVNLAARLESATKTYGAKILISEFTVASLQDEYVLREVDRLRVKGKSEPVAMYEALDWTAAYPEAIFPNRERVLQLFEVGMDCYKSQLWDDARQAFQQAVGLNPADKVSQLYLDRCHAFISSPPDEDWDGVWVMKTK